MSQYQRMYGRLIRAGRRWDVTRWEAMAGRWWDVAHRRGWAGD